MCGAVHCIILLVCSCITMILMRALARMVAPLLPTGYGHELGVIYLKLTFSATVDIRQSDRFRRIFSYIWDRFFPLAAVTSATPSLQIGLIGTAALADRYEMVDLPVGSTPASATASTVAYEYRHAHPVRDKNPGGAVPFTRLGAADITDEWPEPLEFHRLGRSNQGLELVRIYGQRVVHARRQLQLSAIANRRARR